VRADANHALPAFKLKSRIEIEPVDDDTEKQNLSQVLQASALFTCLDATYVF
jgi:hypothetical protein